MSTLFFVKFNKKELCFDDLNRLANEIVGDALKNNYAVAFNDEYLESSFYESNDITILLSDSFLYRHGDELLDMAEYVYESEKDFKFKFMKKFDILTKLIDVLFYFKIEKVEVCIADNNDEGPLIVTNRDDFLERLFKEFAASAFVTGFSFPNLRIQVVKNL